MTWPEIKIAFSMCLTAMFFGCCYLANCYPVFSYLAVFVAGVIFGIYGLATWRDLEGEREADSLLDEQDLERLLPDKNKIRMARKLRDIMRAGQSRSLASPDEARISSEEPDAFRVDNDKLWLVVNRGDHFAFRDPEFPGVTVVMNGEFAMRALALEFIPEMKAPVPQKKRVKACYRTGKC